MSVIDFAVAQRRVTPRPRRKVAPRSSGTGQVIDFPARERRNDQGADLAFCEGNFAFQFDETGWREWLPNEEFDSGVRVRHRGGKSDSTPGSRRATCGSSSSRLLWR